MPSGRAIRKVVKWACVCAAAVSAGAYIFTIWWSVWFPVWIVGVNINNGEVAFVHAKPPPLGAMRSAAPVARHVGERAGPFRWWFWCDNYATVFGLGMPLWAPTAVAGIAAAGLFWRDRAFRDGRCRECGYDRRGLANMVVCPECGHQATKLLDAALHQ